MVLLVINRLLAVEQLKKDRLVGHIVCDYFVNERAK